MAASPPLGRRPGDPEGTRQQIASAARVLFGQRGYEGTTIRAVAARAEVDPALVIHHFDNKEGLFVAAHELPFKPGDMVARVAALPVSERGEALTRLYLTQAMTPGSPLLSILRSAATNPTAAEMVREFITGVYLNHADELIPGPDSRQRLALAGAHLLGVALVAALVELEPLASTSLEDLIARVSPAVQTYFD